MQLFVFWSKTVCYAAWYSKVIFVIILLLYYFNHKYIVAQVQFSKLLFFYRYVSVAANELEVLLIQRK